MPSAIRTNLSGSTDGKPIKINASSGASGTLIHTATSNATPGAGGIWDEIWLWAYNSGATQPQQVTIEFGGTTSPDNEVKQQIPALSGAWLVCSGTILQNSKVVRAFASNANIVTISGFVNRVTN